MTTIIDALDDDQMLGAAIRDPASWTAWRVFLAALFGLLLSEDQAAVFRACTGRTALPAAAFIEAWLICGRRAGKSFVLALVAVYLACFRDYRPLLAIGERATIMVIAADRKQARTILRYVRGLLSIPILAQRVESDTAESIEVEGNVTIEIGTASHRSTRGYTIAAALCDELAFWPNEDSSDPDYEVLDALRPGMGTIPGSMLLCASSPYAQRGALHDAFRDYFAKDDPNVLVWRAATLDMNPTFPKRTVDLAIERDPESARAEYQAEFRRDIADFVTREAVEACISRGVYERAPVQGQIYVGFVDPSGGSVDSFTLGIAHSDGEAAVLDCIREVRPPFSPEAIVAEFCQLLKTYRVLSVTADHYAGEWPREQFSKYGIGYNPSAKPKSEIYTALLPMINSRRADLLDDNRLVAQLCGLERRTGRSGKDSVDHAPGAHDDRINSAAGALLLAAGENSVDLEGWARVFAGTPAEPAQTAPSGVPSERVASASAKPAAEDLDLMQVYEQTCMKMQGRGFRSAAGKPCRRCGLALGGTRVSDGVASWHPQCI